MVTTINKPTLNSLDSFMYNDCHFQQTWKLYAIDNLKLLFM